MQSIVVEKYYPVVYDNLVYGNPRAVRWGPLEKGIIAESKNLDAVIEKYQPEEVIHFAAYS